jgi:hypothetical protein
VKPAKTKLTVLSPREAYERGIQPSASRSALLLECAYWIGKEVDHGLSSEPARYGTAFHALLAKTLSVGDTAQVQTTWAKEIAHQYDLPENASELVQQVDAARQVLHRWLARNNPFRIDFVAAKPTWRLEAALALTPLESARWIKPHDKEHRYHDLKEGEIPGTLDLGLSPRPTAKTPLVVMEHKTGEEDFSRPLDKAQLLTQAAGAMRATRQTNAIVGVLHARRRGMPKIYAERVALRDLATYEGRLQRQLKKIDDGSMRPGPWCQYCPAKTVCPARDAELLSTAGDVLTGLTAAGGALSASGVAANDVAIVKTSPASLALDKRLGLLYSIVRKAEAITGRVRQEIKDALLSNPHLLPQTLEGEYLSIRTYEKESLSKSSVLEAYGKIEGDRQLNRLREAGAIKVSRVQQLWPEKER